IGGMVHGTTIPAGHETRPVDIAKYETTAIAIGAAIKGINNLKFKTIGKPKISGSLILKIPEGSVNAPKAFARSLFVKKASTIAKPSVDPPPPIQTKIVINSFVIIFGKASPASKAKRF